MKKQFIYDKLRSKDGSTLLMTVVVFLVVVIILMGSSMVALANFNKSKTTSEYTSVYYVAETGLNRYIEELKTYLSVNQDIIAADPINLGTKFASSVSPGSDSLNYDFGIVMNEPSKAIVTMDFVSQSGDTIEYHVYSEGLLGNQKRLLRVSVVVTKSETDLGESVISIDAPAILSLDLDVPKDTVNLEFSGSFQRVLGPYITPNSGVKTNSGSQNWYGPFIFGGNLTDKGGLTAYNPLIIYGNYFVDGWNSNISVMMLAEESSKIIYSNNSGTIDYLFVPTNYDIRNIVLKSGNSNDVATHANNIKSLVKNIVRYDPKNFNPYGTTGYTSVRPSSSVINTLFGEEGTYPYKSYFSESFFLRLTPEEIKESSLLPQYKFPPHPSLGSYEYPWVENTQAKTESKNMTVTNELISFDTYNAGELVLRQNISTKKFASNLWTKGTINIGDRNIEIAVGDLDISNLTLEVIGTGTLTFRVVGQDGYVNKFVFSPTALKNKDTATSIQYNDLPSRFRIIVGKTDKGNGPITMKTSNSSNERMSAVILSEDLNVEFVNDYHGVFLSLEGTKAHLSKNSGSAAFSGILYMPKARFTVGNDYSGSIIVKNFEIENSGVGRADYVGSMSDTMIEDIFSFLDYDKMGSNIGFNPGDGAHGGTNEIEFIFNTKSQVEIGD